MKVAISRPFMCTVAALVISKTSEAAYDNVRNERKAKKSGAGCKPKLGDFDLTLMRHVINESLKNPGHQSKKNLKANSKYNLFKK